jgi:hypothetical protein
MKGGKRLKKLKGRDHLRDLGIDGGNINTDMGTAFTWVRTRYRGWLVTWW